MGCWRFSKGHENVAIVVSLTRLLYFILIKLCTRVCLLRLISTVRKDALSGRETLMIRFEPQLNPDRQMNQDDPDSSGNLGSTEAQICKCWEFVED